MKWLVLVAALVLTACERVAVTPVTEKATASPSPVIRIPPTPTPSPTLFSDVTIRSEWKAELDRIVFGIVRDKARYLEVQNMRNNGVPWFIVGGLHERESSRDFTCHLHEGSPLQHRTRDIPKGRLPPPQNPPFIWPQSAEDALYVLKREDKVNWSSRDAAIDAIEAYNGLGYRKYHPDVKSPYLYSATTLYQRGKYTADGKFDRLAVDRQAGVIGLWKRMLERNLL